MPCRAGSPDPAAERRKPCRLPQTYLASLEGSCLRSRLKGGSIAAHLRSLVGNHPSVTFGDSSPRRGAKGFGYRGGFLLNAFVVFYCNAPERSRPFPTECFGMGDEPSTIGRAGSPDHAAEWREPCDLPQPIVHGLHSAGGYGEATNQ